MILCIGGSGGLNITTVMSGIPIVGYSALDGSSSLIKILLGPVSASSLSSFSTCDNTSSNPCCSFSQALVSMCVVSVLRLLHVPMSADSCSSPAKIALTLGSAKAAAASCDEFSDDSVIVVSATGEFPTDQIPEL